MTSAVADHPVSYELLQLVPQNSQRGVRLRHLLKQAPPVVDDLDAFSLMRANPSLAGGYQLGKRVLFPDHIRMHGGEVVVDGLMFLQNGAVHPVSMDIDWAIDDFDRIAVRRDLLEQSRLADESQRRASSLARDVLFWSSTQTKGKRICLKKALRQVPGYNSGLNRLARYLQAPQTIPGHWRQYVVVFQETVRTVRNGTLEVVDALIWHEDAWCRIACRLDAMVDIRYAVAVPFARLAL